MRIAPNATDQSVFLTIIDDAGALVDAATLNGGLTDVTVYYKAGGTGTPASSALQALASGTTAHNDWSGYAVADGVLRVDLPDAPWAAGSGYVIVWADLGDLDPGYAVAGGSIRVDMGYALQNPDSSTTALARASDVTTITDTLATIATLAATSASQTTGAAIRSAVGLLNNNLLSLFRLVLRKDAAVATDLASTLAEINVNTGTGTGSYNPATESIQAAAAEAAASKTAASSVDGKLTTTRAEKLDSLLSSGTVASSADITAVATATPLAERPNNPNRTRKVRRTSAGLTCDAIVLTVGDNDAAFWFDFSSDLQSGSGISSAEGAIGAPAFSPSSGLAVASYERTGDRPSKGVLVKFDPTTANSYTMSMAVTYSDGQGTHVLAVPVTVKTAPVAS